MPLSGFFPDLTSIPAWLITSIDITLVILVSYLVLLLIGGNERRTIWMVRGLITLMLTTVISNQLGLVLLSFLLEKLVLGAAVAMAFIFQAQFRRALEQLGRGDLISLFKSSAASKTKPDNAIETIVEAVKELSQSRTGALIVLDTYSSLDESDFENPGVMLNADISKELIQTIFQTSTPLHDGAIYISGSRIVAAGVILPISGRAVSRQLGTRHRAAIGMTERAENCVCIVVSEETGSISLAEKGKLERPLTSNKLKELLLKKFSPSSSERDAAEIRRKLRFQGKVFLEKIFRLGKSVSQEKKEIE
ncbi:MAG: TIGR00159 family protein [Cyanobacteria bacterium J083]|nr:MAG: TIGR00159 family protein [Cyanobacteria bacterium J083]